MRQQDVLRRDPVRLLRSIIGNAEIGWQRPARGPDVHVIISWEICLHEESLDIYRGAGWHALVSQEERAIAILSSYLPDQASPAAIREPVQRIILAQGASRMKDIGPVMKTAVSELRGRAGGSLVNQIASGLLT